MTPITSRAVGVLLALSLCGGVTGCLLNVFQTADTVERGEFVFWSGVGARLNPTLRYEGLAAQLHVRYGLSANVDVGAGSGLYVSRDLTVSFLGVLGDLRYQLNASPAISLGLMSGDFPFGEVLSGGALYASWSFGSVTPYGIYRLWVLLPEGQLTFSHQATLGVEIFNRPKLPAIFEMTWRDGQFLAGFALRL
jgi:hypothetical protein